MERLGVDARIDRALEKLDRLKEEVQAAGTPVTREELGALLDEIQDLIVQAGFRQSESNPDLEALAHAQHELDVRISSIENSRLFRYARFLGKLTAQWKAKAGQLLLHSPLHGAYLKLFHPQDTDESYRLWVTRQELNEPGRTWCSDRIDEFAYRPLFTILMPTHNPQREWLEAAINSVENQSYPDWELSICDDSSSEAWVREYLEQKAAANSQILFVGLSEHCGISGALNHAGRSARGHYVAFLDQDDVLAPNALFHIADLLQKGQADIVYSDEDRLSELGKRVEPAFKPDWSPDLLSSCMYLGHLFVVSKAAIDGAGWFRSRCDGSQDYDLALRLSDGPVTVQHLPRPLYHWRKHEGSTSANAAAKPYTHAAGRMALEDMVDRRGWNAVVSDGSHPNTYRIERMLETEALASIIIVSRNARLLGGCIEGIKRSTSYRNYEIVVVQHRTGDDREMDVLLERHKCKCAPYSGGFDFATMNNRGVEAASGEVLVFLNDDVAPLVPEWLRALVSQALRHDVGVVGAKLLYPSDAIQHAGIAIGIMDGCGHPLRGAFAGKYWNWADVTRNVSAVTGACMAVRKELFEKLGGFDPIFPVNYNDADLCLRARRMGYEVVYEPAALLRHDECRTRVAGTAYQERIRWRKRWGPELSAGDPFYNASLTRVSEDASLRLED